MTPPAIPRPTSPGSGPPSSATMSPGAQTDLYRPTFGTCDSANSVLQNPNNFIFKDITTSRGHTAQLDLTASAPEAKNYTLGSYFGTIEAGFKFANAHKYQDATETVYDGWSTKAGSPRPPSPSYRAISATPTTTTSPTSAESTAPSRTSTSSRPIPSRTTPALSTASRPPPRPIPTSSPSSSRSPPATS